MDQPTATDQAGSGGSGARRRRPLLASLTTLGVVTGLLGVAGVFAAGSDQATTGTNDAISGDIDGGGGGGNVDLQLATATLDGSVGCNDDWSDDLATGVITSDGLTLREQVDPQYSYDFGALCVRNVGDTAASVTISAFDLVETEVGCSPGEADLDDSCGVGQGELAHQLSVSAFTGETCEVFASDGGLGSLAVNSQLALATVLPGEVVPVCLDVFWAEDNPIAQSDQVSWRFAFDAVAGEAPPPGCVDDGYEDNDSLESAAFYPGPFAGTSCPHDQDWFRYTHPGGVISATLTMPTGTGSGPTDLDLVIYDSEGGMVVASDGTTNTETATSVNAVSAGTYYVAVLPYQDATNTYDLVVQSFQG